MSWKCVLVGLALVLPGFLLIVEGRDSEENRGARHKRSFPTKVRDVLGDDDTVQGQKRDDQASNSDVGDNTQGADAPAGVPQDNGKYGQEMGADVQPAQAERLKQPEQHSNSYGDNAGLGTSTVMFITIVTGCTVLAAVGIIGAGVCWYKYHKAAKAASDVEYPAYGVTGPTKDRLPSPGDRKLAQSAQMYHYQHQKQQMIAMEKANGDMKHDASDDESEEDNVEGDYTVYECPGLAPTGEMEVKNPLFRGDETPSTPANEDGQQHPGAGDN